MGVFLAIAFDAAAPLDGWASAGSSASLCLAMLTSLGLWLLGRRQAHDAAAPAGGRPVPGFAERVGHRLAWRLRMWPAAPSRAAAALVLSRSPRPLAPDRGPGPRRSWDPAALSAPLRAPPGPDPDPTRPPRAPTAAA